MRGLGNVFTSTVFLALLLPLGVRTGAPLPREARAQGDTCTGDCNGDRQVAVNELIIGVSSALRGSEEDGCAAFDANENGGIEVDELVLAVSNSFTDCGTLGVNDVALTRLAAGDLPVAHDFFAAARTANPDDHLSQLLAAILGPVNAVLDSEELRDLAVQSGLTVSGDTSDACSLHFETARIPAGAPGIGSVVDALRAVLIPALTDSLERIETIPGTAVIRFDPADFPPCAALTIDGTFEIDGGDLLALRAAIEAVLAALDLATAYDIDVGLSQMVELSPGDLLGANPDLLTLQSGGRLASGRDLLASALDHAVAAIDAIREEQDGQDDDFVVILPQDATDADKVRRMLERGRQALFAQARIPIDIVTGRVFLTDDPGSPHEGLNLDPFFSGTFADLRPFLPALDEKGNFDADRFPDPTFAGGAPDLTQADLSNFLRDANFGSVDNFVDSSDFYPDGIEIGR